MRVKLILIMANRHFFQPLLPGFDNHLTIPVAFLKNIEGRYEQKTAELRSDASKIIWEVKLDGRRLTDGWKDFALSHNLRVGDIVVFRQEKDLSFHVTLLGPSCCEILYESCLDEEGESEKIQEESKKRSREAESSSSLDSSCFVANVSPSSLRYDLLYLPMGFVRANGIVTGTGKIVLMNENGTRSWTLKLRQKPSCGTIYIRGGWRSFCGANRLKAGDIVTFKLIQRGATLALRFLSSKESEEEEEEANEVESLSTEPECEEKINIGKIEMKKNPKREIETSSLDPTCFVVNLTPATLRYDRLNLPKSFVMENCLETSCGEIVLMNEKGRSWTLKRKTSCGTTYIRGGWRSFCRANGLRVGSFFTFKLIRKGRTQVLRLTRKEPEEQEEESSETNEVESLSTEPDADEERISQSQECSRREAKKGRLIWKPSASPSQNRFVTLTVTPYNINSNVLRLPLPFTRMNNINEETKMIMLDKQGVKWPVNLRLENEKYKRIKLGGSWKDFLKANSVKTNESFMLELIWEEDKSCVLKFCSKVKL